MKTSHPTVSAHQVVSRDEWLRAREELLTKEKELTRLRDELSRQRRELPWVKVDKRYVFDGPHGRQTLPELFAGRSQLIVYHFMFGPGWVEGGRACAFLAYHIDGTLVHLEHHDVSLVVVSRAPRLEVEAFKKRMGWRFKWVSSYGADFNFDYHVSFRPGDLAKGKVFYNYQWRNSSSEEQPGVSVFYKDAAGDVFHTYSAYARGGDLLLGTYNYLDLTPKGRNESGAMSWVRLHDTYDDSYSAATATVDEGR